MAVDSNVLIFERIREELRTGKTIPSAVDQGFGRAFITIIDTHVTTIISSLFLFVFGTGPIRGFAVTLGDWIARQSFLGSVRLAHDLYVGTGTQRESGVA